MAVAYMLDTNIASFVIKDSIPGLRAHVRGFRVNQIAVSVVTEAELLYGLARKPEATRLKPRVLEFLGAVKILPWTSDAAEHYALTRASLERIGRSLDDLDMMIAAHALAEDAVLVTNDAAFQRIEHLKTEDWTV
ncbi:MAG TPA: type II toxin-antitoxin system VapC family toxin [Silvibacterium sp.]|jgi:tRNA(fMet)-specific endonuclease VapC|nr:type II toxin-antitoxin system VapC family toxin [Silvibacterium sp.]